MTDAITRRRFGNGDFDYEFDFHVVGVRIGNTGKVRWEITHYGDDDPEYMADILEKVVEVLRQPNLEDG